MPYAIVLDQIMQYHGFPAGVTPANIKSDLLGPVPSIIPPTFIKELGPTKHVFERNDGILKLTLTDHIRTMVYALLSNNRPWEPIASSATYIDSVFYGYSASKLKSANPDALANALLARRLGNRSIRGQMKSLKDNILYLEKLNTSYGSIDKYYNDMIAKGKTVDLVKELTKNLRYMGISLTCEYLKGVGVDVCKPDIHVVRFVSSKRMNWEPSIIWKGSNISDKDKFKAIDCIASISAQTGFPSATIDALIWNFCNEERGICGDRPTCSKCPIRSLNTPTKKYCHN